jgi:hypothetical protein
MSWRKRFVTLALTVGALTLTGCPGKTANSVSLAPLIRSAQTTGAPVPALSPEYGRLHHSARRGARDSSLALYNNREYGISFRYPRNYALEEGHIEERSYFLKRQDALEPSATLLATVLIPEDAYPNTTFEHGSLQVVVHELSARESCRGLVPSESGEAGRSGVRILTLEGVPFWWSEEKSTTAGMRIVEREYAGFSDGTCYAFFAVVAVGELPDQEGAERQADTGKILRQLEKILSSVQLHGPTAAPAGISRAANGPRL